MREFLPQFKAISVREFTSENIIEDIIDAPVTTVTDPVFLLSSSEWKEICTPVETAGKFMFLYFLREEPNYLHMQNNMRRNMI